MDAIRAFFSKIRALFLIFKGEAPLVAHLLFAKSFIINVWQGPKNTSA